MRLWHYELLPYLPKSQLLAQKRECDLIWKDIANGRRTNHVLINYIWDYDCPDLRLYMYYELLKEEFERRGFKFRWSKNANTFCVSKENPFPIHHNNRYLIECYFNLEEKRRRGQKDFDAPTFWILYSFVNNKTNGWLVKLNEIL